MTTPRQQNVLVVALTLSYTLVGGGIYGIYLRERVAREIHNADASAEPWSSTSWDAAYRVADAVIAIVVEARADVVIRRAAPTAFVCREFACAVCGRPVALGETVHPECQPANPAQERKS